jgi:8-oxo-dGTP diphosphatase
MLPTRRLPLLGRSVVDVAVGVLRAPDGRVLLTERKAGKDAAGFWELPGGQVEPGESPAQAAARELFEEVGVEVHELAPWRVYEHDFPTKRLRLHWFHVRRWSGEAKGREGQRLAWVDPARPTVAPLLPSNELAMATLALPELVGVARVNHAPGAPEELLAMIPSLAVDGLRLLIVRALDLAPGQRVQLTRRLSQLRRGTGLRILLSGTAMEARQAGACGLHSSAAVLAGLIERPADPPVGRVGAQRAGPRARQCAGCRFRPRVAGPAYACPSRRPGIRLGRPEGADRSQRHARVRPRRPGAC